MSNSFDHYQDQDIHIPAIEMKVTRFKISYATKEILSN